MVHNYLINLFKAPLAAKLTRQFHTMKQLQKTVPPYPVAPSTPSLNEDGMHAALNNAQAAIRKAIFTNVAEGIKAHENFDRKTALNYLNNAIASLPYNRPIEDVALREQIGIACFYKAKILDCGTAQEAVEAEIFLDKALQLAPDLAAAKDLKRSIQIEQSVFQNFAGSDVEQNSTNKVTFQEK